LSTSLERDHFRWAHHSSVAALDSFLARAILTENRIPLFLIALWRRGRTFEWILLILTFAVAPPLPGTIKHVLILRKSFSETL